MSGRRARLGMQLFIVSEGVFFLLLLLAYVSYHRQQGNGPTAAGTLDVARTGVFTVFLLASSGAMMLAERGFRGRSPGRLALGLAAALVCGAVFLAGQGLEYAQLLREDVTISRDLFGTTFFTLTGFHALHVLAGLVMIAVLLGLSRARGRRGPRPGAMEAVSIYWHFVDGVWIVIFGVVYLWTLL